MTSSLPGEGKKTTAINLTITLADAGSRVALVDADPRRPSIASYLGLEGSVGLTTVLIGQANAADAIQPWGKGNLHVLPAGQVPPNPSELLSSRSMATLLEALASQYDVVLIDTLPCSRRPTPRSWQPSPAAPWSSPWPVCCTASSSQMASARYRTWAPGRQGARRDLDRVGALGLGERPSRPAGMTRWL